jgi:hypothetical protein
LERVLGELIVTEEFEELGVLPIPNAVTVASTIRHLGDRFVVSIWGVQGFACRPCSDGRNFAPCQSNGCMHQVTTELVLRELDKLLSDRSLGTSSPWRIVYPDENHISGKTLCCLKLEVDQRFYCNLA